jgi:hypothetical protein
VAGSAQILRAFWYISQVELFFYRAFADKRMGFVRKGGLFCLDVGLPCRKCGDSKVNKAEHGGIATENDKDKEGLWFYDRNICGRLITVEANKHVMTGTAT